jgi:formyltetrahydrofolate deformylase
MSSETVRLLITCPDTSGIIAAAAGFIARHNGNILEADQHSDPRHGEFFMRLEIDAAGFGLTRDTFGAAWQPVADEFNMGWRINWGSDLKRMAVLVSKESHCLNDLLWRWRTGELRVEIPFVASNHPDLAETVKGFDLHFHHLPVTPNTTDQQERRILGLLDQADVDLVVLARYMQILSPQFVAAYPQRIINIHHSFLPAFSGPRPYHQAYERGVKIIGATSHYVTEDLDAGPIIAQQTIPVDHRDTVPDLIRKGRDLERIVLATAVRQHVEDKVLVSKNKTVVFD